MGPISLLSERISVTSNRLPIMPVLETDTFSPPTMSSTLTDNDKLDNFPIIAVKRPDSLLVKEKDSKNQFFIGKAEAPLLPTAGKLI